jgi:hypothetical protein
MGFGFIFGISLGIVNRAWRAVARVLALGPAIVAYLLLKPTTFGQTEPYQLSTSQLIGVGSALVVSYFYARFWEEARKHPAVAMSIGDRAAIAALKGEDPDDEPGDGEQNLRRTAEQAPGKHG